MPKKKTNYEKRGLVQKIAGNFFSPQKDTSAWRPRKNQFERLDGDDDEFEHKPINRAFSVESDTNEYRRELMFEKKKAVLKQTQKRDLSSITIKPSARDKTFTSPNPNKRSSVRPKKQRTEHNHMSTDPFHFGPIDFNRAGCDESIDDTMSRQTTSSRQTSSTRHTAFNTVRSDPSDFFSFTPSNLTKGNLDLMSAQDVPVDGIENRNPRSKFYQFTIDEDKESTVILPVGYSDENTAKSSEEDFFEEDSEHSLGITSKGTHIQRRESRHTEKPRKTQPNDGFQDLFSNEHSGSMSQDFFPDPQSKQEESSNCFGEFERKRVTESSNSLSYSPSDSDFFFSRPDGNSSGLANEQRDLTLLTPPPKKLSQIRPQSQPRPSNGHRMPLSPLNIKNRPNSANKVSSMKKNPSGAYGMVAMEVKRDKRDPEADWATPKFEQKPDPAGHDPKDSFSSSFNGPATQTGSFFNNDENQVGTFGSSGGAPFASSSKKQVDPVEGSATADPFSKTASISKKQVDLFDNSFSTSKEKSDSFDRSTTAANTSKEQSDPFDASTKFFGAPLKQQVDLFAANNEFDPFDSIALEKPVDAFIASEKEFETHLFDTDSELFAPRLESGEVKKHNKGFNAEVDTVKAEVQHAPVARPKQNGAFSTRLNYWTGVEQRETATVGVISEERTNNFDYRRSRGKSTVHEDNDQDGLDTGKRWTQQVEKPIGIQSFQTAIAHKSSSGDSMGSASREARFKAALYSKTKTRPKQLHSRIKDVEDDKSDCSVSKQSTASYGKPLGLPNNAIAASMLFRTHHNVDTRAVEAKIRAKEEENSKIESIRGDVPQSIQAFEDTYSSVSSFSEDTARLEAWKKPSRDLVDYFATSRRTDWDARKYVMDQQKKATGLCEA